MAYFPMDEENESAELLDLYQEIVAHGFGADKPINWFRAQAIRPDILNATWSLVKGILVEGQLPPTVKQMIAMTVSIQNDCRYCTVIHTGALHSLGVPTEVIESCARDPETAALPPTQRQILRFALKVARDPNSVGPEDYAHLHEQGLSREEVLEIVMMASFTNFINTWADASGIALDG